ncbi:hypothetical protein ACFL96_11520 [Thermoproteota archaeon]
MEESMDNSKDELKRADHLIYVSLKYTRTCDIFKSILERLTNSIDFMLDVLLMKLEQEKAIESIPEQPIAKSNLVKEKYEDERIKEMADLYMLMRLINRAPFERAREFRRHVTMTVNLSGEKTEVNIDIVTEYYKKVKEYFEIVDKMVKGEA